MPITSNVLWDIEQVITSADFTELNLLAPTLDPRITFSRTTTKSYIASDGTRQIAAANVWPREFDPVTLAPLGRSVWAARTNLFLNSDAPVTQDITVTAVAHTLSFEGTGTITLSGAATGSLVGGGAGPAGRRSLTFTPTAGALTVTLAGSVQAVQVEAGPNASPYIATAGSPVIRAADSATVTTSSIGYSTTGGTWYAEAFAPLGTITTTPRIIGYDISNITPLYIDTSMKIASYMNLASISTANATSGGELFKAALAYASDRSIVLNGGNVVSDANVSHPTSSVRIGALGSTSNFINSTIKRIRYFPTRLSNAMIQQITTL